MKANVPKKIYVNFPFGERYPERGPMVTKQGLNAEDVEYTCTDAFIEKACSWMRNYVNPTTGTYLLDEDIEKFRKAMKGE